MCACVCDVCVPHASQTVTNGAWPKFEQNILYDLHFDDAVPRFLFFPVSIQSLLLLVHDFTPSLFARHPPFLLILSHNQFNLSPPVSSAIFPKPRLFASHSPPTFLFATFLYTSFLSSIPPSIRVRKIREGVKTGENGEGNRTVVGKKMERGRKRLKG